MKHIEIQINSFKKKNPAECTLISYCFRCNTFLENHKMDLTVSFLWTPKVRTILFLEVLAEEVQF